MANPTHDDLRADLLDSAARHDADAATLIAQYGYGVRPAWVSTDLALAQAAATRLRIQAAALGESAT